MKETVLILLSTSLVNNFVLVKFLGLCPLMGVSKRVESALGMGLATTFVLTLSSVFSHALYESLLQPLGLDYLRIVVFIVVIAIIVQFTESMVKFLNPWLHQILGLFLPLITTNCMVLGVALLNAQTQHGFLDSFLYGFGAAMGFTLVLILFAAMREKIDSADVPKPFKGEAIALITLGLISLAFMGFTGLVKE